MTEATIHYDVPKFAQIMQVSENDAGADLLALDVHGEVWLGTYEFYSSTIEWEKPAQHVLEEGESDE